MYGKPLLLILACAAAGSVAVSCKGYRTHGFTEPMKLGNGKVVPAPILSEGERSYALYCRACHGDKGDLPIYRTQLDNEVLWCFGVKSGWAVNCTTAVNLGVKS